jgi:hypothetical protein
MQMNFKKTLKNQNNNISSNQSRKKENESNEKN